MSRAEVLEQVIKQLGKVAEKGKVLKDDLIEEVGEYLETGTDYISRLGGRDPIDTDTVVRNVFTNKFNRQADLEGVKYKKKGSRKTPEQLVARENFFKEAVQRREQQIRDYIDEDYSFGKALELQQKIFGNLKQGGKPRKDENYNDFLEYLSDVIKNKSNDKESFDKFSLIYDSFIQKSKAERFRGFEEDMLNLNFLKQEDIVSKTDALNILKDKGFSMRGYEQGADNPGYIYSYLSDDMAKVTENYRNEFIKIYNKEPIGRGFSREDYFKYVSENNNFLKNYFEQVGYDVDKKISGITGDLAEFKRVFYDAKNQFPSKIGQFDPGTEKSLNKPRSSEYVADYIPGEVRWTDGSVLERTSQGYKDIQNFKKEVLEFVPQNESAGVIGKNLDQQINRMINKQIINGVDPKIAAENTVKVLKNTNKKTMSPLVDLLSRKTKIQNRVQQARDRGLNNNIVDDISLAHVTDVADDYRLALDIDNLFLAPLKINQKQYNFYDKALRELQGKLQSGVSSPGMSADITNQIDDLGKQLEFEGIVTDVGYGRVGKAKSVDDVAKMYDDQVDFYMAQPEDRLYTADMNTRIQEGAQGPGFAKGGEVDEETGQPIPDISIEFGGDENSGKGAVGGFTPPEPVVDTEEDIGIGEYLTDAYTNVGDSVNEFTEGNMYRLLPKLISKGLSSPGDYADSVLSKVDDYNEMIEQESRKQGSGAARDEKMDDQTSKFAQAMANPVIAGAKVFDFITMPLQKGYENMFSDDDSIYIPFYGEIPADTNFKKAVAAGATVGLTVLEVAALFSPAAIARLGGLATPKIAEIMARHSGKILTTALIGGYELKDPFIFGEGGIIDGIAGFFQDNEGVGAEAEDDLNREIQKEEQRNVEGNQLEYAEGGMVDPLPPEFTGEYAETKLAMGGDPGQFSNPTPSGLEEEIDVGDYLLEPAYESVQDLDNIFDITRQAEDAFETDGGFLDDQAVEVASRKEGLKYIFGEVPNWVRQGKERIQMGIEKILPKTGDELEESLLTRADEIDDGLTPITKSQPGQLFYSKLEAELMQGPKEYKDVEAFKKYYQSRNIPKIEIIDSELERIIEGATKAGQPISREMVLGALKESPIRYVQSKGYGFLSNVLDGEQRGLKYSGYKEYGAIPNTDRERLLFIDPNDLRGDPGRLPPGISPHDWQEPYTIAWSRLSDRQLGGKFTGKTTTFADEIQSDIFQAAQKTAGRLSAKIKYMAQNNVPLDTINNELQRDMMTFFADKGTVYRESLPGSAQLQKELQALMGLQDQLTALKNTPVPEITDEMLEAAQKVRYQQSDIIDNMTEELNLQLVKQLYPNLPFKLRGQWADASIKRDIYEAAYRKFVLKDPNATDFYAVTPANLVTKRYSHSGSSATSQADRVADKDARIKNWVDGGMEGDVAPSQYPGIGMYEFYGGPGADVVTDTGKHYTSEIEKIMKRIAKENNVNLEVLPVRVGDQQVEVFNVVNRETGEILGTGNTGRQADAIANDIIDNSDIKVIVERANQFDTADSFGIELTPEMAEAFKAYMAKGGYVQEEIVRPYGD